MGDTFGLLKAPVQIIGVEPGDPVDPGVKLGKTAVGWAIQTDLAIIHLKLQLTLNQRNSYI